MERDHTTLKSIVNCIMHDNGVKYDFSDDEWKTIERKAAKNSRKITTEEFIDKVKSISPDIDVLGEYINATTKIPLRCKICGKEWTATPHDLLRGHGCPACKNKKIAQKKRKTHQQFISELSEINPKIEILGEYTYAKSKLPVRCLTCGYQWNPISSNLLKGSGCPVCARNRAKKK